MGCFRRPKYFTKKWLGICGLSMWYNYCNSNLRELSACWLEWLICFWQTCKQEKNNPLGEGERLGQTLKPNLDPSWLGKNYKGSSCCYDLLIGSGKDSVFNSTIFCWQGPLSLKLKEKKTTYRSYCFKRSDITKNTKSPEKRCKCSELHCTHNKHFWRCRIYRWLIQSKTSDHNNCKTVVCFHIHSSTNSRAIAGKCSLGENSGNL